MIDESDSSLWWEEFHGPRSVRAEIYAALCDAKSVVLAGKAIPWSRTLRSLISTDIQSNLRIYTEEILDAENEKNPGECLLRRFGKAEDRNRFRERIDPPLPEYIKDIRALEKRFIFISGIGNDTYKSWERFLQSYKSKKPEDGIFLIETSVPINETGKSNKITVIDVASKITFHDVFSFSMLLASKLDIGEIWKQYTAWMTSLLFGDDVELLADIITNEMPRYSTEDYHNIIKNRLGEKNNYDKSLWTAQIQILFPIIENLRASIIEMNFAKIEKALEAEEEDQFGNRVTDPFDAELGFLFYLSSKNHLFSYEMHQHIQFLRDCRNRLAHIKYCEVSDIDRIISLNSRFIN